MNGHPDLFWRSAYLLSSPPSCERYHHADLNALSFYHDKSDLSRGKTPPAAYPFNENGQFHIIKFLTTCYEITYILHLAPCQALQDANLTGNRLFDKIMEALAF